MFSRILLPVDFSERAGQAARHAIAFAGRFHSRIVLLHVLPPHFEFGSVELGSAILQDLVAERLAHGTRAIAEYLKDEFAPFETERLLLEGDPAHEIVGCAQDHSCDLIMMPTHGHGRFRRLLLGSVTAQVLHDAHCPVWTTAHVEQIRSESVAAPRHIVCAIDLDGCAARTLGFAARLAAEFGARLTLVHALPYLDPRTEGYQLSPEWRRFTIAMSKEHIGALQKAAGTEAETVIEPGEVAKAVPATAARLQAELLVIGRSSGRMFGRLTAHAYGIIRSSPCPVISV